MSDTVTVPPEPVASQEDKILPGIVYGLYLLAVTNGLTAFIGLIVAYANRGSAGPVNATHYTFQIRTAWMTIGWALIGLALFLLSFPLMLILIGFLVIKLAFLIWGLIGIWFVVRSIMGAVYLAQGQPYPRPLTWLL